MGASWEGLQAARGADAPRDGQEQRGEAPAGRRSPPTSSAGPAHLQHVVQQRHAALLRLGLRELQQRADLEAIGVPCVAALRGTAVRLPGSQGTGLRAAEAQPLT